MLDAASGAHPTARDNNRAGLQRINGSGSANKITRTGNLAGRAEKLNSHWLILQVPKRSGPRFGSKAHDEIPLLVTIRAFKARVFVIASRCARQYVSL